MEVHEKLEILSDAAKYDVSCASSGSTRKNTPGGIGTGASSGICHSWSEDGRCVSLLKVLMSNDCVYNCAYCVNRSSNDIRRTTFTPDEIADLTINFYRRNYIEGLFLSSAVVGNPDSTMEMMIGAVRKLREVYRFNGYIHMKAIPGADPGLLTSAGLLVDRMSINIELPTNESLKLLAPQKKKESITGPMGFIKHKILENVEDRRLTKSSPIFVPAGQSTQMIVGATPDHDLSIIRLSENLYKHYQLRRVYYSAYVPVSNNPRLPAIIKPPLMREHRLYQADWLLRFYGFKSSELLDEMNPDFDLELDPKSDWALRNLHLFPVEVNKADYYMLLRVPGIGQKSAHKITTARRVSSLSYDDLKKLGVVLKRAKHFITCKGKFYGEPTMNDMLIRQGLVTRKDIKMLQTSNWQQMPIFTGLQEMSTFTGLQEVPNFTGLQEMPTYMDNVFSLTGEL